MKDALQIDFPGAEPVSSPMPVLCWTGFSGSLNNESEHLRDSCLVYVSRVISVDVETRDADAEVHLTRIVADAHKHLCLASG